MSKMFAKLSTIYVFVIALTVSPSVQAEAPQDVPTHDVTPTFHYVAPGWNAPQSIEFDPYWQAAGLPERGTNFYLMGAPATSSPFWTRFDPSSPLYQAWFGAYVVRDFQYANEWSKSHLSTADIPNSIQRVIALASIDQMVWLTAYGDPAPKADVVPGSVVVFPIGGNRFAIYCEMRSHSDVGAPILPYPWYPPASSSVTPFAPITLHSTAVFTYLSREQRLVITYAVGVEWDTKDGQHHATPADVYLRQAIMLAATTFN